LTQQPGRSQVRTDYAQSFSYNPVDQELYVLNERDETLLVLSAGTLEQKKLIPSLHMTEGDSRIVYDKHTVFGVRTLAIDPERSLLLTASLATNMVDVIDLTTYKRLAKCYVAPWLRCISLDTKACVAYVSSTEGLFRVVYTARLRPREAHRSGNRSGS